MSHPSPDDDFDAVLATALPARTSKRCIEEGCDRFVVARDRCNRHYKKLWVTGGLPLATAPSRRMTTTRITLPRDLLARVHAHAAKRGIKRTLLLRRLVMVGIKRLDAREKALEQAQKNPAAE